jgi:hypothetical protein
MAIVQEAADGGEEGNGVVQFGWVCGLPAQAAEPLADVGVAQTAGALLDVGLKVEECLAVLLVAFASERDEFIGYGLAVAAAELCDRLLAELREERVVSTNKTDIKQRDRKLRVGFFEALALGGGTGADGNLQTAVPELLREAADGLLGESGLRLLDAEEKVYVGVGKEQVATEASDGGDGDAFPEEGVGCDFGVPEAENDVADQG